MAFSFLVVAEAVALLSVLCCSSAAAADGFKLQLLDPSTGALCLDGTPGGYYSRPGTTEPKSWVVHFEGGGWCVDEDRCLKRSTTAIGSSKGWPAAGLPSMDGGAHGLMSSDPEVSPFAGWSKAHVNYCDGG
eukprot:gene1038-6767_t